MLFQGLNDQQVGEVHSKTVSLSNYNSKLSNLNLFSEVGLFLSEILIISRAVNGESYTFVHKSKKKPCCTQSLLHCTSLRLTYYLKRSLVNEKHK